jgi:hypothetical protein
VTTWEEEHSVYVYVFTSQGCIYQKIRFVGIIGKEDQKKGGKKNKGSRKKDKGKIGVQ